MLNCSFTASGPRAHASLRRRGSIVQRWYGVDFASAFAEFYDPENFYPEP